MALFNHPGHADQGSHGRKRGAGKPSGVRESLANARTTDEVAGVLRSELRSTMGRDVDVNLQGMDAQIARETSEGILRGAEKFPDNELGTVTTFGTGGALPMTEFRPGSKADGVTTPGKTGTNSDRIAFNVSRSPQEYREKLAKGAGDSHGAKGGPMGVAIHEFGHVATTHNDSIGKADKAVERSSDKAGEDFFDHIGSQISTYGSASAHEMTAEAFADVMLNGSSANPLSKEIFDGIPGAR